MALRYRVWLKLDVLKQNVNTTVQMKINRTDIYSHLLHNQSGEISIFPDVFDLSITLPFPLDVSLYDITDKHYVLVGKELNILNVVLVNRTNPKQIMLYKIPTEFDNDIQKTLTFQDDIYIQTNHRVYKITPTNVYETKDSRFVIEKNEFRVFIYDILNDELYIPDTDISAYKTKLNLDLDISQHISTYSTNLNYVYIVGKTTSGNMVHYQILKGTNYAQFSNTNPMCWDGKFALFENEVSLGSTLTIRLTLSTPITNYLYCYSPSIDSFVIVESPNTLRLIDTSKDRYEYFINISDVVNHRIIAFGDTYYLITQDTNRIHTTYIEPKTEYIGSYSVDIYRNYRSLNFVGTYTTQYIPHGNTNYEVLFYPTSYETEVV